MTVNAARPNFFIVGAPKSGTTALDHYLAQHPDIFIPEAKELQFFGSDLETRATFVRSRDRFKVDEGTYLRYFEGARGEKRIGESTVWYLYSRTAAREIYEFNPDARIIIMLRNPVDAMVSLHQQHLYDLNEDIEDFAEALAAESDRKAGRRIPENCYWPASLFYREIYRYSGQVERYLEVFGSEAVQVVVFDDFAEETPTCYREVLEFLEVDPDFQPDFEPVNVAKTYRSAWLQRMSVAPPRALRVFLSPIVRVPALRNFARALVKSINTQPLVSPKIDPGLRAELIHEFEPEICRLKDELGIDIADWTTCER